MTLPLQAPGLVAGVDPTLILAPNLAAVPYGGSDGRFIFDNVGARSGTLYWDGDGRKSFGTFIFITAPASRFPDPLNG